MYYSISVFYSLQAQNYEAYKNMFSFRSGLFQLRNDLLDFLAFPYICKRSTDSADSQKAPIVARTYL